MAKKAKPIWVYDPLHGQNYYMLLGYTKESAQSFIAKQFELDVKIPSGVGGRTIAYDKPQYGLVVIVYMPDFRLCPSSLSLLSHELVHAAFMSLGHRGYQTSHEDHEELAYLQGFLMRETLRKWSAQQRKTRKTVKPVKTRCVRNVGKAA